MKVLLITTPPNAVLGVLDMLDNIKLHVIDCSNKQDNILDRIFKVVKSISPDMIITYRCPYILPKEIFLQPQFGSYNIHPSLLPKHSGLNPWKSIMSDADQINGVTLHRISQDIDQGEQIAQSSYSIADMSYECARQMADDIAGIMISDFIKKFSHL